MVKLSKRSKELHPDIEGVYRKFYILTKTRDSENSRINTNMIGYPKWSKLSNDGTLNSTAGIYPMEGVGWVIEDGGENRAVHFQRDNVDTCPESRDGWTGWTRKRTSGGLSRIEPTPFEWASVSE